MCIYIYIHNIYTYMTTAPTAISHENTQGKTPHPQKHNRNNCKQRSFCSIPSPLRPTSGGFEEAVKTSKQCDHVTMPSTWIRYKLVMIHRSKASSHMSCICIPSKNIHTQLILSYQLLDWTLNSCFQHDNFRIRYLES